MLVDSVLQVYIREAQASGSLFGRVGDLFHSIAPIPDCTRLCRTQRCEGTVGSASCPWEQHLEATHAARVFQSITRYTTCQGLKSCVAVVLSRFRGEERWGSFRSRWDDRCGVDHPGSGTAPGWLGLTETAFSWVLGGSTLARLGIAGYPIGGLFVPFAFPFRTGYKQNNPLLGEKGTQNSVFGNKGLNTYSRDKLVTEK